jgi:hypothetical protein
MATEGRPPMSGYLFTFRAPPQYVPSADTFDSWAAWQLNHDERFDSWLDMLGSRP